MRFITLISSIYAFVNGIDCVKTMDSFGLDDTTVTQPNMDQPAFSTDFFTWRTRVSNIKWCYYSGLLQNVVITLETALEERDMEIGVSKEGDPMNMCFQMKLEFGDEVSLMQVYYQDWRQQIGDIRFVTANGSRSDTLAFSTSAWSQAEIENIQFEGHQKFIGMYATVDNEAGDIITNLGMLSNECKPGEVVVEEVELSSNGFSNFLLFCFIYNLIGIIFIAIIFGRIKMQQKNQQKERLSLVEEQAREEAPAAVNDTQTSQTKEPSTNALPAAASQRSDSKMLIENRKVKYTPDDHNDDEEKSKYFQNENSNVVFQTNLNSTPTKDKPQQQNLNVQEELRMETIEVSPVKQIPQKFVDKTDNLPKPAASEMLGQVESVDHL